MNGRRQFIRNASLAAAAAIIPGCFSFPIFKNDDAIMKEKYDALKASIHPRKDKYDKFLDGVRMAFSLDKFVDIVYHDNVDDLVKNGFITYASREKFSKSAAITFPVGYSDSEPGGTVKPVITQISFNYPMFKTKSLCVLFPEFFDNDYYSFMSSLVDHEYKHAENISGGIFIDGVEIKAASLSKSMSSTEEINKFYDTLMEIVSYRNQLDEGIYSDSITESFRHQIEGSYLDYYFMLWNHNMKDEGVKYVAEKMFYEPWLKSLVSVENGIITAKNGSSYPINFDIRQNTYK